MGGDGTPLLLRATAEEVGFMSLFRLIHSRSQASQKTDPLLPQPAIVLSMGGDRRASGKQEKCPRTQIYSMPMAAFHHVLNQS